MQDENKRDMIALEKLISAIQEAAAQKQPIVVSNGFLLSALRFGYDKAKEVAAMQHALDLAWASNTEHLATIENQRNRIIQLAAANRIEVGRSAAASVVPAPQSEAPAAQESTLLRSPRVKNNFTCSGDATLGAVLSDLNRQEAEITSVILSRGDFLIFYKTYEDQ